MNRKEIKELAKAKIKGNIWNLIWPLICIGVISTLASNLGGTAVYDSETMKVTASTSPLSSGISLIVNLAVAIITAGYIKYVLNFVRTGKLDTNEIINTVKEKWLNVLIADILVGVIVAACSILFVIPGIIMALAYSFTTYLIIDTDVKGQDSLKQSREMMKGYKWDYFVFILSFAGWALLGICTCGILFIWLAPYFNVAQAIYYDKLKEATK